MSKDKRERIQSFRFLDDQKRSVAGEMLARKLISKSTSIEPGDILFSKTKFGKPFAENVDIEFNISHSNDMVACAVDKLPIGIDIEKIRPINLSVAKHFCSADDMFYIFGQNPTINELQYSEDIEILKRFFEVWTKKEAYGKCKGTGIIDAKSLPIKVVKDFRFINDYALAIQSGNNV